MSEWVVDAGEADFESEVIVRSAQVPVVVDFWAPWCAPCRQLGPVLERLAAEHDGAFLLVRVNVDENPALSGALGVQSIPMVLGFRDGKVVAEFVGALPESGVREFLARVLPSEADRLATAGDESLASGHMVEAEAHFSAALARDARCGRALLGLARIRANHGEDAQALQLLDRIPPGSQRAEADQLAAEIRVRQGGGGDEAALRVRLAANPADLEARCQLGQVLGGAGKYADALEQYLEVVRRDRDFRDGAARKAMLDIFELLGARHEITEHYRSELAKVLFR
jgi:putative thioredoxin